MEKVSDLGGSSTVDSSHTYSSEGDGVKTGDTSTTSTQITSGNNSANVSNVLSPLTGGAILYHSNAMQRSSQSTSTVTATVPVHSSYAVSTIPPTPLVTTSTSTSSYLTPVTAIYYESDRTVISSASGGTITIPVVDSPESNIKSHNANGSSTPICSLQFSPNDGGNISTSFTKSSSSLERYSPIPMCFNTHTAENLLIETNRKPASSSTMSRPSSSQVTRVITSLSSTKQTNPSSLCDATTHHSAIVSTATATATPYDQNDQCSSLLSIQTSDVLNVSADSTSLASETTPHINTEYNSDYRSVLTSFPVDSPGSSNGSTTVSANSSPDVEQQQQGQDDEKPHQSAFVNSSDVHFSPINELYSNHPSNMGIPENLCNYLVACNNLKMDVQTINEPTTPTRSSMLPGSPNCSGLKKGGCFIKEDCLPNPYNHSLNRIAAHPTLMEMHERHLFDASPPSSLSYNPNDNFPADMASDIAETSTLRITKDIRQSFIEKENKIPLKHLMMRRTKNCTMLNSYKQPWRATNNHFLRYSDVKPREEQRFSFNDAANKPRIKTMLKGWKIHYLKSTISDLGETESLSYDRLSSMLNQLEPEQNVDIERICDLLKGNMQRSKIIIEGLNEAEHQIMKVFDHKASVANILNRCSSKRNLKKREKF